MRSTRSVLSVTLVGAAFACGSVPSETSSVGGGREVAPVGVIRGTVVYSGPRPCSSNGHIVGAAVLFVFDRRNPPPPHGLASTPANFGVVTGDTLFANEPRNPGPSTYCPQPNGASDTVTVSAPFTISPLAGGSYVIQSFYDYTGDFLPTFKFRNLPEKGDVGGGNVDTADALKPMNAGNPNYQPHFLPVDVGIPQPFDGLNGQIPNFVVPDTGVVADNVTVTLGVALQMARPYFYPAGATASFDAPSGALTVQESQSSMAPRTSLGGIASTVETDKNFDPILTIPQDIQVLAAPNDGTVEASVNNFEGKLPHLVLHGGLPKAEYPAATAQPFHFQLPTEGTGGFTVWQNALFDAGKQKWVPQDIPEGGGIPSLWPLVVLTKLVDDPGHTLDPSSVTSQGSPTAPLVLLQGITLLGGDGMDATRPDSLFNTGQASAFGNLFDNASGQPTIFKQDHLTVLIKPAAICFDSLFDPKNPDKRGTLVAPYLTGPSSDVANPIAAAAIVPPSALANPALATLIDAAKVQQACIPTGRYAINVVYPDGQAWTVPNEAGACSRAEGATDYTKLSCTLQPRPILYSQGTRAVVEIVKATDLTHCIAKAPPGVPGPPPAACTVQHP